MGAFQVEIADRRIVYSGTKSSKVFVLLGHPVVHSLSPRLQMAGLAALGLDAVYLAVDIVPERLPQALEDLRAGAVAQRIAGANVTSPHKQTVMRFMDAVDDTARMIGAVNTIVCSAMPAQAMGAGTAAFWRGHNTDVDGLVASLGEHGVQMAGAPVLIVGAGGMARSAVVAALGAGAASVRVLARRADAARHMLDSIAAVWSGPLPLLAHGALAEPPPRFFDDAVLLVQTTSLGMKLQDPSPLSVQAAPPGLFVFEAIYRPAETALLRAARAAGLRCTNGLGMLVHQGGRSLHLWTGLAPPVDIMRRSVGLD